MSSWFFYHPIFLILLPVLVIPWLNFTKKTAAIPFPGSLLLENSPLSKQPFVFLSNSYFSLSLFFLVLGLSQPAKVIKNAPVKIEGLAVEFVLDVSGSMAEIHDFDNGSPLSRLSLAKKNILNFLKGNKNDTSWTVGNINSPGRQGDLIGLVSFASQAKLLVPLTLDHSAFISVLDKLQPKKIPGSSETNISDALALAIDKLDSLPDQRKLILLLTDGEQNVVNSYSGYNPIDLAVLASKLNIAIYTLDVGFSLEDKTIQAELSTEEKEKRRQARDGLMQIAQITNGLALDASNEKKMTEAFQKINQMEQQSRDSLYSKPARNFYPWCVLASLVLFGLGVFSPGSPWQRIN